MAEPALKYATYADVLAAPEHLIAEVIDGELYTQPRPALPHAQAASVLSEELGPPFKRGRGGPGGWIILYEPEMHLGDAPQILVPDLAGWRRTTLPELPEAPYVTVAPDWLCEVLSPGTEAYDRSKKMRVYEKARVGHIWLVDPLVKTLEVYRLELDGYRWMNTYTDSEVVRAEPYDAIELALGLLWER